MSGPIVFVLIIAAILIGLPAFWLGVLFWTSRIGGWNALAAHYSAAVLPNDRGRAGVHLYMKPSRFSMATYGKSIRLRVNHDALFLSTMGPWKPFHKPLRLPFEDMRIVEKGETLIRHIRPSVWPSVEITFMRKPSVELSFRKKDFEWIMQTHQNMIGKHA